MEKISKRFEKNPNRRVPQKILTHPPSSSICLCLSVCLSVSVSVSVSPSVPLSLSLPLAFSHSLHLARFASASVSVSVSLSLALIHTRVRRAAVLPTVTAAKQERRFLRCRVAAFERPESIDTAPRNNVGCRIVASDIASWRLFVEANKMSEIINGSNPSHGTRSATARPAPSPARKMIS